MRVDWFGRKLYAGEGCVLGKVVLFKTYFSYHYPYGDAGVVFPCYICALKSMGQF